MPMAQRRTRPHTNRGVTAASRAGARKPGAPTAFEARGKLVCLAEEMRDRYKADVPPVHDHILGLRLDEAKPPAKDVPAYVTILRTPMSAALFSDERFRAHTVVLSGRIFPGTSLFEVSRTRWIRDDKLEDVYYWCEVCAIRTVDPGPCACCQGKVELRESLVE